MPQIAVQLLQKLGVSEVVLVRQAQLVKGLHERLGDEAPAIGTEMAAGVR